MAETIALDTGIAGLALTGAKRATVAIDPAVEAAVAVVRSKTVAGLAATHDPYWNNVSLLLRCDGADGSTALVDLSENAHAITASGTAIISTAEKQFGTGSLSVGSNSGYIETSASSAFSFPGDFTIELWAKFNISQAAGTTALLELSSYLDGILIRSDNTYVNGQAIGWSGLVNTSWRHLALTRSGSTIRWFRNGIVDAQTLANSQTINSTNGKVRFGADIHTNGGSQMTGFFDEIRITKGVARYTANFAPPTAPFPAF